METPSFADGLGRRVPQLGPAGERLESLRLCAEIGDGPATQAAVVERAAHLSDFQCPAFARVHRVERLGGGVAGGLAIVADSPAGIRLSDLLRQGERRNVELDANAALFLLQHTTGALAALHGHARDAAHGAIGPERVVVTPDGSPVIVEFVLGSALEQLQLSRSQLWALFRIPVPSVAGTVRFDQQTDVVQLGVFALALLLGRVLLRDEFPQRVPRLLDEAATLDACHEGHGVSRPIRSWVARALQLDSRSGFRNAIEAEAALALAITEDKNSRPSAAAVQAFVSQCCALEDSPAFGVRAQRRVTPSGAVVNIPPRADVTTRLSSSRPAEFDRGSGAQRVSRGGPEPEPTSVQVLADLSAAPPASSPKPVTGASPSAAAPSRQRPVAAGRTPSSRWVALRRLLRVSSVVVGLLVLFGASFLGARAYLRLPAGKDARGTVVVDSRPAGLELLVDGQPSGRTPATLELTPGAHSVAVRGTRGLAVRPITVVAGRQQVERIEVGPAGRHVPRAASRK